MSDQNQRQIAVEPRRSVIVQAPAGSGKTTLLVERYLGLLGVVEAPEEILAITFTRKAAAEMRERILQFLDPDYQAGGQHEEAALAKARAVADKVAEWGLLDNPQRLLIRTIDSFNHYLARTMPVASQLGPVPAPAENSRALYREAARRTLARADGRDELAGDVERLLLWRDHRSQDIEDLLVALLGKREQWLRALGMSGRPEREVFEQTLREVVDEQLESATRALTDGLAAARLDTDALLDIQRRAAACMRADEIASPLDDCDELARLPGADPADLPAWRALGFILLTNDGNWRIKPDKRQGFPPKSEHKDRIVPMLDALRDNEALAGWIDRARALPEPRYGDDEWDVLAAMIRVLEASAAELELVFAETGQSDFAGIGAAALRGLGDEETGFTDLALYLDRRIRHILVDEYQDTNWGQYHLLEKLVGGWQPGEERSLFLVGDPMQSIYRFREAEVGLFMRTREHGLGQQAVESCRLTRNFRSRAEIVDWVNASLGPAFPEHEDISAGAVSYAPSEAGRDGGGRVEILARPDRATEAQAVAQTVADALAARGDDPDFSAAIIVRARSHLADILPALEKRGVGYRAVKLDPLLTRPVVQDLLAVTRAIMNPDDRAAVLAVLRSPLCGLTLADLHALAGDGRSLDDDAPERLSGDGRARAEWVFGALERAQSLWRKRSMRDLVEGFWNRLGGPQALVRPDSDRRDAAACLDALSAAEEQGLLEDWNAFMELLEEQYTEGDPPSDDVKLEILTMHGAKGLEWDLVVLPGLDRGTGGNSRELLYWLPFTPEAGEERVLLAPLRSAEQDDNSDLIKLIRTEQKGREAFEHQRLLYVAATRAREHLVLSAAIDPGREHIKPTSGSLLADLWPTCGAHFYRALDEAPETEGPEPDGGTGPDQSLRRISADWRPPIRERLDWRPALPPQEREVEIEFNWAGVQVRRIGTVLHRLLERIGQIGIENLDEHRQQALRERIPGLLRAMGTGRRDLDAAVEPIRKAFDRTLESETGRWILSGRHRESACELALSGVLGDKLVNAVIDRTFIDEHGTRWIIDYKSGYHGGGDLEGFLGEESERYQVQLGTYRRLFEQLGETDIKAALYLPRHDRLVIAE